MGFRVGGLGLGVGGCTGLDYPATPKQDPNMSEIVSNSMRGLGFCFEFGTAVRG